MKQKHSTEIFLKLAVAFASVCLITAWSARHPIRIVLIGDSTVADKPIIDNPERGWGQMFPLFFGPDVVVDNRAINGRSTKSFIDEGRWKAVDETLGQGDYVFIQFGHNDEKKADSTRFAEAHTTYKENLRRFTRESRDKGSIPILLTPVERRKFDTAGKLIPTHGDYPAVVRELAREENVPLIDLTGQSNSLIQSAGMDGSKNLFMWIQPETFSAVSKGKEDDTHFTAFGALKIAELVVEGLKRSNLPLKSFLRPIFPDSVKGLHKIVALDYFYNCEWKQINGKRTQFHYTWEDTANSGFSELGKTINQLGAYIISSNVAPTPRYLKHCSVYIIVDPDTPSETEHPNYISDTVASTIAEWVQEGGVLLLLANDKGNVEFDHLNRLAQRFGMHFNEDSHHRVVGNNFDTGKFAQLPEHPIFAGVKQIYLKEICSLKIEDPARTILTENNLGFMAVARIGKGTVFAAGDPWLYNEYYDSRKLPSDYENSKAGRNLFEWLLEQASPTINY